MENIEAMLGDIDVGREILKYLSIKGLISLSKVARSLHQIVENYDMIWRKNKHVKLNSGKEVIDFLKLKAVVSPQLFGRYLNYYFRTETMFDLLDLDIQLDKTRYRQWLRRKTTYLDLKYFIDTDDNLIMLSDLYDEDQAANLRFYKYKDHEISFMVGVGNICQNKNIEVITIKYPKSSPDMNSDKLPGRNNITNKLFRGNIVALKLGKLPKDFPTELRKRNQNLKNLDTEEKYNRIRMYSNALHI